MRPSFRGIKSSTHTLDHNLRELPRMTLDLTSTAVNSTNNTSMKVAPVSRLTEQRLKKSVNLDTLKQNFQRTIQLYFDFMH